MNRFNPIAKLLNYCGFGIIGLGVISFMIIILDQRLSAGVQGTTVLVSSLVTGLLFLGFAEVIHLLQGIYDQRNDPDAEEIDFTYQGDGEKTGRIDREDEREIRSFFKERNQKVGAIHPRDEPFIYIVEVEGRKKKVEAGGFTVKILGE
ncbi:hypothetical protein J0K78_07170 [Halobacillus sp. GSS1]|uniref:hypothetical protein n=1 Tax=Halobacillus sp. GSS1 TaxID=2815919 RepID=UPI001A8C3ABE|nr:hypothetical protein [Halobacillus sp. GSS1]MBN9654039.1 hypothetical protein [Halobacillus sp. GSS1]